MFNPSTDLESRNRLLSNRISLIAWGVTLAFLLLYLLYFLRWDTLCWSMLFSSLLFITPYYLNKQNFTNASRFILSIILPLVTLVSSIVSKLFTVDAPDESGYYDYRFIMLAASVFPYIYIHLKERLLLVVSITGNFLPLVLFDPIHNALNIGYFQTNQDDASYYFSNLLIIACYILLMLCMVSLKSLIEKLESKNNALIAELEVSNSTLYELNLSEAAQNEEISSQHEEITSQTEELSKQKQKLEKALFTIAEQQKLLETENRDLGAQLLEQNATLSHVNEELVKYNNELRQFSYTISHNLRGPIASLLGLNQLINREQLGDENRKIIDHFESTTSRLDAIIKDLSKIIDIRHDIFRIREKILLREVVAEIEQVLEKEIEQFNISLLLNFDMTANWYSVRSMIGSILYNLISNSIKYHSTERKSVIKITASEKNNSYLLEVEDNGLGIDLEKQGENVFKLYKRFHLHTEGKGIGLYLVKLQTEALGGTVRVSSVQNSYTRFSVTIPKPENTDYQILYEQPYATLFYNAPINATGIIWRGPVTSEQYRAVYLKCLEFLSLYTTSNWISDPSQQGYVSAQDQEWLMTSVVPEAINRGLKRIASVKPSVETPAVVAYHSNNKTNLQKKGVPVHFFNSMQACIDWIKTESN